MSKTKAKISGVGSYLPQRILTNAELSKMVDTTDEWIRERVGISERHIATEHETNAFMATEAAKMALEDAKVAAREIDLIIVATSTPDQLMPGVATQVQAALGASCAAFDLNAACGGFVYGLHIAKQFFDTGSARNILLIGSERMSRVMDWQDRSTCVLFGDGAGAIVLSQSETPQFLASQIFADGAQRELLYTTPQFSDEPFSGVCCPSVVKMQGNRVFRWAVEKLEEVVEVILEDAGLKQDQIDWLVPHQANARIIAATAKKLNLPMEKVMLTLVKHGNTTAATIPLALAEGVQSKKIKRGDVLLFEAFGAGFVWGASIIKF